MALRLDEDAKVYLWWDAVLTMDPTGSTVTVEIDGVSHAMTWQGSPVQSGSTWTQTARSTEKLAGSTVTAGAGLVSLTAGTHTLKPIVTTADGQIVPHAYRETVAAK